MSLNATSLHLKSTKNHWEHVTLMTMRTESYFAPFSNAYTDLLKPPKMIVFPSFNSVPTCATSVPQQQTPTAVPSAFTSWQPELHTHSVCQPSVTDIPQPIFSSPLRSEVCDDPPSTATLDSLITNAARNLKRTNKFPIKLVLPFRIIRQPTTLI